MTSATSAATVPAAQPAALTTGLTALVDETVESRIRSGALFTSLDISNEIKRKRFHIRHGEVAALVRDLHALGTMQALGYDRVMIEVNTENGEKTTEAFLYLPHGKHPSDYAGRVQDALPPLSGSASLDPADYIPLRPATLRAHANNKRAKRSRRPVSGPRSKFRRDGALPIPRALVQQAGWKIGDVLMLNSDAQTLRLAPANGTTVGTLVKVWADFRVRVAKTKMGSSVDITTAQITVSSGGGGVAEVVELAGPKLPTIRSAQQAARSVPQSNARGDKISASIRLVYPWLRSASLPSGRAFIGMVLLAGNDFVIERRAAPPKTSLAWLSSLKAGLFQPKHKYQFLSTCSEIY